jgi:hypothetical protein
LKKSHSVSISLVSTVAAAAMAAGCGPWSGQPGWQTCVDRVSETTVDRQHCDDEGTQPHPGGYVPRYHWYYYPRGYYWNEPSMGMHVPVGGSYGAMPFGSVRVAHGSVSRGGFGSTAAGHASGS